MDTQKRQSKLFGLDSLGGGGRAAAAAGPNFHIHSPAP